MTGRLLVDGTEFVALETGEVEEAASDWAAAGVEAVAVCFLHSYVDGAHEVAARATAQGVLGEAVAVSLSSEVSPEPRVRAVLHNRAQRLSAARDRQLPGTSSAGFAGRGTGKRCT